MLLPALRRGNNIFYFKAIGVYFADKLAINYNLNIMAGCNNTTSMLMACCKAHFVVSVNNQWVMCCDMVWDSIP